MKVRYSYLPQQFGDLDTVFERLRELVQSGDFTLGKVVEEFERGFAELIGVKHAVGVNSGTDALKLALEANGVGRGDEVITAANTFIATVGAIAETGATPVLVDCDDSFCIDASKIEAAITSRTRAIMPVHFTGNMPDMPAILRLAEKHGLCVVEDACTGILAECGGRRAGTWGVAAGFSMHPLKNLNVWGDAGVVVTNDAALDKKLRLLRNHGMADRDHIVLLGHNSRLDSVQAVVGNWQLPLTREGTARRRANAEYYNAELAKIPGIRLPICRPGVKPVYHLYMVLARRRDALLEHLISAGIEAKVHYPIALYRQEGLRHLGYAAGAFPVTDRHVGEILTLPVDQYLSRDEQAYVVATIREFYASK